MTRISQPVISCRQNIFWYFHLQLPLKAQYGAQFYLDCLFSDCICYCFHQTGFLWRYRNIQNIIDGVFDAANASEQISIGLIRVMSLFLGFMNIGEKAGAWGFLLRVVGPFFRKLFPEIPKHHPSMGHMMMNFSANLLNLDNAATPFGLKAMQSLQDLNQEKETASNAQIMFMVLHASGLTLIPISVIASVPS